METLGVEFDFIYYNDNRLMLVYVVLFIRLSIRIDRYDFLSCFPYHTYINTIVYSIEYL